MALLSTFIFPIDLKSEGFVYGLGRGDGTIARWPGTTTMFYGLGDITTPGPKATFPTRALALRALEKPSQFEWWPK